MDSWETNKKRKATDSWGKPKNKIAMDSACRMNGAVVISTWLGRKMNRGVTVSAAEEQSSSLNVQKKRKVVDHICLLKAKEDLSDEEEKDMLDFLYTTQYQMRGILAVSLAALSSTNHWQRRPLLLSGDDDHWREGGCGSGKCGPGNVFLVGTGLGDPELLTLKAYRVIQIADLLLYDRLVSNDVLELVDSGAKLLYVGKTAGYHSRTQVFGRGGEEMDFLRQQGIEVNVIPGTMID
ncbi:hypothetical protein ACE6H2_017195 [Prunus campanulata]